MKNRELAKMWIKGNREEVQDILHKMQKGNYNYNRCLNSVLEILFHYDMKNGLTTCLDFSTMLKAEKLVI